MGSKFLEWGPLSALVCTHADKIEFGREGVGQVVDFLFPPLPLTLPSSVHPSSPPPPVLPPLHSSVRSAAATSKVVHSYLALVAVPKGPTILCYSNRDDNHFSLTISKLHEQKPSPVERQSDCQTFEEWSRMCSLLMCTKLKHCKMQEQIQHIESGVVVGVTYLCVTCAHHVVLYTIPSSDEALACQWTDEPLIYHSSRLILHTRLSPYVEGEVLLATEGAGLYLYRRNSKVIHIKRANFVEERGYIVCLFGAHPRHVLWLEQGQLHSLDLRTAKVPISGQTMCAQTTLSVRGVTCAVIEDYHLQPFHCFVATSSKLVLLDLRQPSEPLLSVLHHLAEPPQWLVPFNHSVLVGSSDSSVLFRFKPVSDFSVLLTAAPHSVCVLRDVIAAVRQTELYALCASQVQHRLRQHLIGVALFSITSSACYGAVMMSELGDLFYQCWQYSAGPTPQLKYAHYLGFKLWMEVAHAEEPVSAGLPMTVRDMSCVAKHLITGEKLHPLANHCPVESTPSELETLQSLYQQLVPSRDLDIAMVSDWGRIDMNDLLEEESRV